MTRFLSSTLHALGFIKSRMGEKSTWVSIGATVAAVSALPAPWSYVALGCGVIAAMIPNQGHNHEGN